MVNIKEKERQSRVYANMAVTIFSPIKKMIKDTEELLQTGFIYRRMTNIERQPAGEKQDVFISPNLFLTRRKHNPDNVLNKYLPKIEELSKDFEISSQCIEKILKNILSKKGDKWEEFKTLCANSNLNWSAGIIINEEAYETVFILAITDAKKLDDRYSEHRFYKNNKNKLRSILIDLSFKEDLNEYQNNRDALMKTMKEMDDLIDGLISDWMREYDLIDSDVSVSPVLNSNLYPF